MASEYVLISKHKYEQLEKDANSAVRPMPPVDDMGMRENSDKSSTHVDDDKIVQTPPSPTTTNNKMEQLVERNSLDLHNSDDNISLNQYGSNDDYDTSDILQSFNPSDLKYVQPIINDMEKGGDILTWDKKTGEILFQHKTVSDSNIIELLKDTLTASLHPTGKMEFYRGLNMLNIKPKYLKNPKNKSLLAIIRGRKKIKRIKSSKNSKKIKPTKLDGNSPWISWV